MTAFKRKLYARLSRSQLHVYFALVVLLVVTMIGLPTYTLYTNMLKGQIDTIHKSLIGQVLSTYDGLLQEIDRTSVRLAENAALNQFVFREQNELFESEQEYQLYLKELHGIIANEEKFYSNIGGIYLYIPKSGSIVTSDTVIPLGEYPDGEYVAFVSEGRQSTFWSDVRTTKARMISGYPSKEEVVTLYRNLSNDGLHNDAILFIDVRMSLFRQANSWSENNSAALIISTPDNKLIFSETGEAEDHGALVTKAMENKLDANHYFKSTAQSSYNDWSYSVLMPKQRLFAPTQFVARVTFSLCIAVLIVGLVVSLYFSRRFHRPLEAALGKWRNAAAGGSPDNADQSGSLQDAIQYLVQSTQSYASLLESNQNAIRSSMLSGLLKNNEWPADTGMGFLPGRDAAFFQVITCVRDESEDLSEQDKGLLQFAIYNLSKEWFAAELPSCGCELVSLDDSSICILLHGLLGDPDQPSEEEVMELLGRLREQLRSYPHFAWTFGIGNRYADADLVSTSFRESQLAVQYRVFRGKGSLIPFGELLTGDNPVQTRADEWIKYKDRILTGIRSRNQETTRRAVLELCEWMERSPGGSRIGASWNRTAWHRIHYMSYSIFNEMEKLLVELNVERSSVYPGEQPFGKLIETNPTVVEIRALLLDACERLIRHLEEMPTASKSTLVVSVVEFIRSEFSDQQLSLESTAGKFGMNPSYLGQLLKREMNRTFLQLLSEVRIEQAKRLLADPAIQIQDVATGVGYGNRSTFIRIFKSQIGMTPSEYRNRMLLDKKGEMDDLEENWMG
ncbi:helix-turn-helix domain-containing protein [Paenibacillus pasadenensis]|uniref:helix-turn-helix domain-containing protein n=1 Tax=Paenibacillus pasadenensis TaxID=217090 RepID=UPI00204193A6|nr:helix-turn-helix domain-containing protein [Paenibacillus pasadenensis]MCM3749512.1 helix-turn-helix domain-containing protein [Paenibacillus pasadenensis]